MIISRIIKKEKPRKMANSCPICNHRLSFLKFVDLSRVENKKTTHNNGHNSAWLLPYFKIHDF